MDVVPHTLRHVAGLDAFVTDGLFDGLNLDLGVATLEEASRLPPTRTLTGKA
jgi:hypothetical protein